MDSNIIKQESGTSMCNQLHQPNSASQKYKWTPTKWLQATAASINYRHVEDGDRKKQRKDRQLIYCGLHKKNWICGIQTVHFLSELQRTSSPAEWKTTAPSVRAPGEHSSSRWTQTDKAYYHKILESELADDTMAISSPLLNHFFFFFLCWDPETASETC